VVSSSTIKGRAAEKQPLDRKRDNGKPSREVRPLRVVAIGGGTGLSTLLRGLKKYAPHTPGIEPAKKRVLSDLPEISELTAVVTVTDDGGSSGRLRKEFNILPPGDIRNCLVALSEDEALLSRIFQYRFETGAGLEGHNFGNLFVAALTAVTGDFAEAVRESSKILATRGNIFPSTVSNVQLEALMADDTTVFGETNITASKSRIVRLRMVPENVQPLAETLEAISKADMITMGPGSLFTSLIPNLLVHGIPEAIAAARAVKVYVCNLMTQANESLGLTASDHIRKLYEHAGAPIFDYALVNVAPISEQLQAKYALEGASRIVVDREAIESLGVRCVTGDFVGDGMVVRHATDRVATELLKVAATARSN
jgi:uncharacterized cofD-like protein